MSNNTLTFAFTNQMAIYDPKTDTWTMVAPPFGPDWDFIGDSPWTLLPNGHLLLGEKFTKAMAELDPTTLTWTNVSSHAKDDRLRRGRPYPAAGRIGLDGEHDGF